MGYTMTFSNGQIPNQVKQFVVDESKDIDSIDISQILPGSRAFVISDSQWYMLNNQWKWKPVDNQGGGGGSTDEIIYDGGEETSGKEDDLEIVYDGGEES